MITMIHVVRLVLGLFLFLNGVNLWLGIIPIQHPQSGPAYVLMHGLVGSGLFAYVKFVEILTGALLLSNFFVPLALVLVAPLVVVIAYTDMVLLQTPQGFLFGILMVVLWAIPAWGYLPHYLGMLTMKSSPKLVSIDEITSSVLSKK